MSGMNTDIQALDNLVAVNLDITAWSGRKKLTASDLGGAELPPDDLASLGSKKIFDPEHLRIFGTLKARAVSCLDRIGVRFLGGWAIPEDKADETVQALQKIKDDYLAARDALLSDYDTQLEEWIQQHGDWAGIIRSSTVSPEYVAGRFDFRWQVYRIQPLMETENKTAVLESGLADEVAGLGGRLFTEIAKEAENVWQKTFQGRSEVTHKALSPLRTLCAKLEGLAFLEPHVLPAAQLVKTALARTPRKKGHITGQDLLLLQSVVSLLRDPKLLFSHSELVLTGSDPDSVLAGISSSKDASDNNTSRTAQADPPAKSRDTSQDTSQTSPTAPLIPSLGLW